MPVRSEFALYILSLTSFYPYRPRMSNRAGVTVRGRRDSQQFESFTGTLDSVLDLVLVVDLDAENVLDLLGVDDNFLELLRLVVLLVLRELDGDAPADRGDVPLELSDSRFARVAVDDHVDRLLLELDYAVRESVLLDLLRNQVLEGDLELLVGGIARNPDDFEPVEERRLEVLERVRRGDEDDLREVEGQVQVVVRERVVLGGVQQLQQRRRRVLEGVCVSEEGTGKRFSEKK